MTTLNEVKGSPSVKSTCKSVQDVLLPIFTAHIGPLSSLLHTPTTLLLTHYLKCILSPSFPGLWHCSPLLTRTLAPSLFALLTSTHSSGLHLDETPPGRHVLALLLFLPSHYSPILALFTELKPWVISQSISPAFTNQGLFKTCMSSKWCIA